MSERGVKHSARAAEPPDAKGENQPRTKPRIVPLNLPALADWEAAGNPVTSRLEDTPANCCPGLEIDHRNLDRRFFPGLVFEFVWEGGNSVGARLVAVDQDDPAIPNKTAFVATLIGLQGALQDKKEMFLDSLGQGARTIKLWDQSGKEPSPWNGGVVWRMVRSLEPGKVTITLKERNGKKRSRGVRLTAPRREYMGKDGTLSAAYQAGELTQSLCSPWQHDFRDCACNYWASNHPDIVFGADPQERPRPARSRQINRRIGDCCGCVGTRTGSSHR